MVDILMPSYNQGAYIAEAIESVLKQECSFEFRLLIFDDASSDNSLEICEDYSLRFPKKIKLYTNETNIGLIKNYIKAFDYSEAKYIAILEADDYWIDKHKLGKQVAVLEKFQNVGLVHARPKVLSQNGFRVDYSVKGNDKQGVELFEDLLLGRYSISPLTVMFRRELLASIDFDLCIKEKYQTIDIFLWLDFVLRSDIYFLNDIVGVYRFLTSSVSNTSDFEKRDAFIRSSNSIISNYLDKNVLSQSKGKFIMNKQQAMLLHNAFLFRNKSKIEAYSKTLNCYNFDSFFLLLFSLHPKFYNFYFVKRNVMNLLSVIKQKIFKVLPV